MELLDLRFLLGLRVSISSDSECRAKALFEAAKRFGAIAVGAVHVKAGRPTWEQDGWMEVWNAC